MLRIANTAQMPRSEWLQARKNGIGGSDAGAICGLNPYVSPMQVFLDKTSDDISETDNEAMRQGRDLEEYVAQRFMEATGKKVRKVNAILGSPKYPFMQANIDRIIAGENAGLECKTASAYSAGHWADGQAPLHYVIQCQHYMAVTNTDFWYLAVVILGKDFKYIRISRDDEIIESLIKIEKCFWEDHVEKHIPPAPDGSTATDEFLKKYFPMSVAGRTIELLGYDGKLNRYREVENYIDKLKTEERLIQQEIQVQMGDAEVANAGKFTICWKAVSQDRLDTARLKAEQPDLYRQYSRSSTFRRFSIREI